MLFERIRRTQKPVFIFLALMFGLGFVLLGVGSGVGGPSLGDIFGNNSPTGDSVKGLQSRVADHPKDADAWLRLSNALQADGDRQGAMNALQQYLVLEPKDDLQVAALASLYEQRAQERAASAQQYQQIASTPQALAAASAVSSLKLGASLSHPIATAAVAPDQQRATELQSQATADYQQAVSLRKTAVSLAPQNAAYQFTLATDALNAQDYPTALAALKQYLELEPDAPNAKQIKQVIKQLAPFAKTGSGG
jgi:tetratricopeptide (TPR) repeat protein